MERDKRGNIISIDKIEEPLLTNEAYVGADVFYALGADSKQPGELRPAKVVKVWNQAQPDESLQLAVFFDGGNDYTDYGMGRGHTSPCTLRGGVPHWTASEWPAYDCWLWPHEVGNLLAKPAVGVLSSSNLA